MKAAIITIAGLSSRFNQGLPEESHRLKAIYHEGSPKDTLLNHMLTRLDGMDRIVLVAGYKADELKEYLDAELSPEMKEKVSVVYNDHYEDWASGYSLYLGVKEALKYGPDTVVFAEGDLDVDDGEFRKVLDSPSSVITCNHEIIRSRKAVIGYVSADDVYKYAFSASHGLVSVDEPFSLLFNSGQIWKFTDMDLLKDANDAFEKDKEAGTNLLIVGGYFAKKRYEDVELVDFSRWVNCNTRDDYREILTHWEENR